MFLVSLDISNAFGSVPRDSILSGLEAHNIDPDIIKFVLSEGDVVPNKIGVKQGCPLSPLLFAMVFDVLLFHLSELPLVPFHMPDGTPIPTVLSYLDDILIITSSLDSGRLALSEAFEFGRSLNMNLSPSKSFFLSNSTDRVDLLINNQPIRRVNYEEGASFLGVPLGSPIACNVWLQNKMTSVLKLSEVLQPLLSAHSFFLVIRFSLQAKLSYICRLMDPDVNLLEWFDQEMLSKCAESLKLPVYFPPRILSLPIRLGGAGLVRISEVRLPAIVGSGVAFLLNGAPVLRPSLLSLSTCSSAAFWSAFRFGCQLFQLAPSPSSTSFLRNNTEVSPVKLQHRLWEESLERISSDLLSSSLPQVAKSILSSKTKSSKLILTPNPYNFTYHHFSDALFRHIILTRAGFDSYQPLVDLLQSHNCPLCGLSLEPGHERLCRRNHNLVIQRHNNVVNILCSMLSKVPGVIYTAEQRCDHTQPDITVLMPSALGFKKFFIDVTIGDVLSVSHDTAASTGSLPSALEQFKSVSYGTWPIDHDGTLIPFALSNLGQLGEIGSSWLTSLSRVASESDSSLWVNLWMSLIVACLFRSSFWMASKWCSLVCRSLSAESGHLDLDSLVQLEQMDF